MDRFVTLYRAHLPFVWRVLWRARAPEADINDLAQEVFIVVLRKLRADDPKRPGPRTDDEARAWLYRIATFELKNYRQRARFRQVEPMDDRTDQVPDARDDAAHLEAQEELRTLLDGLQRDRREVFELVELEGVSVVAAARALGISEANAHRRLALAREDIEAAAAKLAQRNGGTKATSAFLLPFGVGAWLQLRDLANPPPGTADLIWKRLQDTMATMDQENDRPAQPPQERPAGRPSSGPSVKALARYLLSAGVGGAIVALLFLLRPNAGIAILRMPGPVVVVTSATATPSLLPAPSASDAPPSADAIPTPDATIDEETQLMRQARAAYAAGDVPKTIQALTAYERRFPAGRFSTNVRAMRATLGAAGGR